MSASLVNTEFVKAHPQVQRMSRDSLRKLSSTKQSGRGTKRYRVSHVRVTPSAMAQATRKSDLISFGPVQGPSVLTSSLANRRHSLQPVATEVKPSEKQRQFLSNGNNEYLQRGVDTQHMNTISMSTFNGMKTKKQQTGSRIPSMIMKYKEENLARHRKRRRAGALRCCTPPCCLTTTLLATLAILAVGAGLAALLLHAAPKSTSKTTTNSISTPTSTITTTTTTVTTSTSSTTDTSTATGIPTTTVTSTTAMSISSSTSSTSDTSTFVSTTSITTSPITTSTTETVTTSSASTSTTTTGATTPCGTAVPACTSCTSACSSGLLLTLSQSNASAWGNNGTGFTQYQYTWLAPSTTSATILFQFLTTKSNNFWDLDDVSVKDSSGAEKITNGGFATKSSWNETCSISGCASIQNYGPGLTKDYWVSCISMSNYYSVSQTFPVVACARYNISFIMARYKGSSDTANAYVSIS